MSFIKIQPPKLNEEETKKFREKEEAASKKFSRDKSVSFTGHRSDKLGGYNMKNPKMLQMKEVLLVEIERLIKEEGIDTFYTGAALGLDQAAFWCIHIIKKKYPHVRNIVAMPYRSYGDNWTEDQIIWRDKMLGRADSVIIVDELKAYQKDKRTQVNEHSNYKLIIRNGFLVDHCRILIAVWNGVQVRGTWNCIKTALPLPNVEQIIHFHSEQNFVRNILK